MATEDLAAMLAPLPLTRSAARNPRSGQALMELAVGMFTLALVVSALVAFATYIARSLEAQNLNRGDPPKFKESIPLLGVGTGQMKNEE